MVQGGLVLGAAGDRFECEAERVARQVVGAASRPAGDGDRRPGAASAPGADGGHVGAEGGLVGAERERAIARARGGGHRLPGDVRRWMEAVLGADLGDVWLHTDDRADRLARSLQARAFTTGRDIFFRHGEYGVTGRGLGLLAHELTHVVQQAGGSSQGRYPVSAAPAYGLAQRAFGFEFETTVQVRGTFSGPWEGRNKNLSTFADEEQVYRQGSWKVVTDTGRLEFVTDPLPTLQAVQTVTKEIEKFITGLQGVKSEVDIRKGRAGTWAERPARPKYTVHIGSGLNFEGDAGPLDWYGQPQLSVGVVTERVGRFLAQSQVARPLDALKAQVGTMVGTAAEPPMPTKGIPSNIADMAALLNHWDGRFVGARSFAAADPVAIAQLVTNHAAALPQLEKDKLSGLWTLMAYYWGNLSQLTEAGTYKKSKLVVMARTDFHSFYKGLNAAAKQAFRAAEGPFVNAGAAGPIIGTKIDLARWYRSVSQPEDGSTYDKRPVDLLSANRPAGDDAIAIGTDKSMGQYPLHQEGPRAQAVFELRRVTPGIRVPIGQLYAKVLQPVFAFAQSVEK